MTHATAANAPPTTAAPFAFLPIVRHPRSFRIAQTSRAQRLIRAQAGDETAFEQLVAEHRQLVERLCRGLVRRPADLDDAVQESILSAWRSIGDFGGRGGASFTTWLYRVTYNATQSMYRRRELAMVDIEHMAEVTDRRSSPEDQAVGESALRWALNQIPEDFRCAIVLADQIGLAYKEIAEIQFVSEATVKTRVFRARQALRVLLDDSDA